MITGGKFASRATGVYKIHGWHLNGQSATMSTNRKQEKNEEPFVIHKLEMTPPKIGRDQGTHETLPYVVQDAKFIERPN